MSAKRIRRVKSREELERVLDDYITTGFVVIEEGTNNCLLRKHTWGSFGGHILWGLLTFWFSVGFGNLAYALVAHYTAEQIFLKTDAKDRASREDSPRLRLDAEDDERIKRIG